MNCLLCNNDSSLKYKDTFICSHCSLVFKNPKLHSSSEDEFKRYSTHNNNNEDQGYLDFLNKLVHPLTPFLDKSFSVLDFGCGPGPTLGILLEKIGGKVENYDPIFLPNKSVLQKKYDVVTSSEVVEHFKTPKDDWKLLVDRVKPGGLLGIMTLYYNDEIDYKSWWYKNDHTHVVFYQEKTLQYLADYFGLDVIFNDEKSVIIFRKSLEEIK